MSVKMNPSRPLFTRRAVAAARAYLRIFTRPRRPKNAVRDGLRAAQAEQTYQAHLPAYTYALIQALDEAQAATVQAKLTTWRQARALIEGQSPRGDRARLRQSLCETISDIVGALTVSPTYSPLKHWCDPEGCPFLGCREGSLAFPDPMPICVRCLEPPDHDLKGSL